jgi:hypothetical protein
MFIGHFAIAFLLMYFFPTVPYWVPLIGVSFPDLLWPILILIGVEKVSIKYESPLQSDVNFLNYPYSHSLILSSLIEIGISIFVGIITKMILAVVVFLLACTSHWILDTLMHLKDLPILGFGKRDKKIGLGLWQKGLVAFTFEYIFYAIFAIVFLKNIYLVSFLILGSVFHLANANSFFGLTKKNPFRSERTYAIFVLFGFCAFIFFSLRIL